MNEYQDILKRGNTGNTENNFLICDYNNRKNNYFERNTDLAEFYLKYSENYFYNDYSPNFIGEKVNEDNYPLFDTFVFKSDGELECSRDLYLTLVKAYNKTIKELVDGNEELNLVVLERPLYKEVRNYYFEVRIQSPFCRINREFHKNYFHKSLLKNLKTKPESFFENQRLLKKTWTNILNEIPDYVELYGSFDKVPPHYSPTKEFVRDEKKQPFLLYKCYGPRYNEITLCDIFKYDIHESFELVEDFEDYESMIEGNEQLRKENFYLPIILSMYYREEMSELKIELDDDESETETIGNDEPPSVYDAENPTDFEIIKILIECLSDDRFDQENFFLDIGRAIYNSMEYDLLKVGLEYWKELSKRSQNKDINEEFCDENYFLFDSQNYVSCKTVAWYAKEDNKEKYDEWHVKWYSCKISYCIENQEHECVAEAFYRRFWLEFLFCNKKWYHFRGHHLDITKDTAYLSRFITQNFTPIFDKFQNDLSGINVNTRGNSRLNNNNDNLMQLSSRLIKSLKTITFKKSIFSALQPFFLCENIEDYIDSNINLLGLKNCVIETTEKKVCIRIGKPEDYITKSMGVQYRKDLSYKSKVVKEAILYRRQVFPHPEVLDMMKRNLSSYLKGGNKEKLLRLNIGETNGSKSILSKILKKIFGDYAKNLPDEYYSAKQKNSTGLDPAVAQLKNSRLAFSSEPDDDNNMKGTRVKKATGGDSQYVRGCGSDGGNMENTWKVIMDLNIVPHFDNMDEAGLERFLMIPFEGRWYDRVGKKKKKLPEDIEEQIKLKKYYKEDMTDKILPLAQGMLWLMVQEYPEYVKRGLEKPPYIENYIDNYWKTHDPVRKFIDEKIERKYKEEKCDCTLVAEGEYNKECEECDKGIVRTLDQNSEYTMTRKRLYQLYKNWLNDTYNGSLKPLTMEKLVDIISTENNLGPLGKNNKWWGIDIKQSTDEDDEGIMDIIET